MTIAFIAIVMFNLGFVLGSLWKSLHVEKDTMQELHYNRHKGLSVMRGHRMDTEA